MNLDAKYPGCEVQLTGFDGNAFAIMGAVTQKLRHHLRAELEMPETEIAAEVEAFCAEAMSGDYDNLLRTCMKWVDVS